MAPITLGTRREPETNGTHLITEFRRCAVMKGPHDKIYTFNFSVGGNGSSNSGGAIELPAHLQLPIERNTAFCSCIIEGGKARFDTPLTMTYNAKVPGLRFHVEGLVEKTLADDGIALWSPAVRILRKAAAPLVDFAAKARFYIGESWSETKAVWRE